MASSSTEVGGIFSKLPHIPFISDRLNPPKSKDRPNDPTTTAVPLVQTSEQEERNKRLMASLMTKDWTSGLKLGGISNL